jgi:hypothetical protein
MIEIIITHALAAIIGALVMVYLTVLSMRSHPKEFKDLLDDLITGRRTWHGKEESDTVEVVECECEMEQINGIWYAWDENTFIGQSMHREVLLENVTAYFKDKVNS